MIRRIMDRLKKRAKKISKKSRRMLGHPAVGGFASVALGPMIGKILAPPLPAGTPCPTKGCRGTIHSTFSCSVCGYDTIRTQRAEEKNAFMELLAHAVDCRDETCEACEGIRKKLATSMLKGLSGDFGNTRHTEDR